MAESQTMRIFFSLLLAIFSCSLGRADLVLIQDVNAMGQQMTMTMKVKGDLTRVDLNPQMSIILDAKTGDMINLLHSQKMFMKMNVESMKGMMNQMLKAGDDAKPEIKATGEKQKINGYDTEEYVLTKGSTVSHLWIAKDFPNYQAVLKATEAMKNGPLGRMTPQSQIDMSLIPGMPIKTTVEANGQPSATVTLKSVEEKDLDPAEFAAPADYKTLQMPSLPPPPPSGGLPPVPPAPPRDIPPAPPSPDLPPAPPSTP